MVILLYNLKNRAYKMIQVFFLALLKYKRQLVASFSPIDK